MRIHDVHCVLHCTAVSRFQPECDSEWTCVPKNQAPYYMGQQNGASSCTPGYVCCLIVAGACVPSLPAVYHVAHH